MQGMGNFTWEDGRMYLGEYRNDLKHGQGTFQWPDGRKYIGGWSEGKQHGRGTFVKDGGKREGIWELGKRIKWLDKKPTNKISRDNLVK